MERNRAIEFTRQNTGKHFLDSGFASGRMWQQPPPTKGAEVLLDEYPTISLTQWLVDCATERSEFMEHFEQWADDHPDDPWFDIGREAMEAKGYVCATRGNTYNGENDLDQEFVYEVWLPEAHEGEDYWWSEHAVLVMYIHTGADVRGGYGRPLAVEWDGELVMPADLLVEYHCEELTDVVNDRLTCGYSRNPRYQLESEGFEFVEVRDGMLIFTYDDGDGPEEFEFSANRPYC
jgi:hypothetical protein